MRVFICSQCGVRGSLDGFTCGHRPRAVNDVFQLTGDPDIRLDGADDGYIGYEGVGAAYEGSRWPAVLPEMAAAGRGIAALVAEGPILDLGCGSGAYAVPLAMSGRAVIAADISNRMLQLARERALMNGCDLTNLTLCRINALSLPLADGSMGGAMANSVLHLIGNPQRVIEELHRVLRPGAPLVLSVNSPGLPGGITDEQRELSRAASCIISRAYEVYWGCLASEGVRPSKLSWKFDQFTACRGIFGNEEVITIPFQEQRVTPLRDGFLARFRGKGLSDQQGVPEDAHGRALAAAYDAVAAEHGSDFADAPVLDVIDGIHLHVYRKSVFGGV